MLHTCTRHGQIPTPIGVSQSIFDHVENSNCPSGRIYRVYFIYPDYTNKIAAVYLDEADFSRISDYVNTLMDSGRKDTLLSILDPGSGREIVDDLFLIDRDKEKKKINDRLFLKKMERRMKAICPECLQERLGDRLPGRGSKGSRDA
jgi:hypothetical protein